MKNKKIDEVLDKLHKSKFRSNFKLKKCDIDYINTKGIDVIEKHAYDFILKRLSQDNILNDGKQTPMRGHPVFIAQHATATCCRKCLYKWHHIKQNVVLTYNQQEYIVNVIMKWIKKELENNKNI